MKANRNVILFHTIKLFRKLYVVHTPAFLDPDIYFPKNKTLESNWKMIRDEILAVVNSNAILSRFHEVDKGQSFISNNDGKNWDILLLKLYDMWHHDNMKKCPGTVEILKSMPNVTTAVFSILAPGKHIPPHKGPYKGILRYQLALEVPVTGDCYIKVDGREYRWIEGKGVIFDDTFTHEVHNNTEHRRIALLLDIKRHDFNFWTRILDRIYYRIIQLSIIFSGGIGRAKVH